MQLSPLQSRLAASVVASCFILAIYFLMFSPQFAFAAELSTTPLDAFQNGWAAALEEAPTIGDADGGETKKIAEKIKPREPIMYESNFGLFDRSVLGRAPSGVVALANNAPKNTQIDPGTLSAFVFEAKSVFNSRDGEGRNTNRLELRGDAPEAAQGSTDGAEGNGDGDNLSDIERRESPTKTLWISANTCMQPERKADQTTLDPPQLTLYVSTASDNTSPGPMADKKKQDVRVFNEGAVMYNTTLRGDVYFTIAAPPNVASEDFDTKTYNVNIAASIDKSYYSYDADSEPNVFWVDSDSGATLMASGALPPADQDASLDKPPYTMFVFQADDLAINGVRNSYCGLKEYSLIGGTRSRVPKDTMVSRLVKRGTESVTKQEFFLSGLNASTKYTAVLASDPNAMSKGKRDDNIPGGGGFVFRQTGFETSQTGGSCFLIQNLEFCDQTQYRVPGNLKTFANATALGKYYDSYAQEMYKNFDKALQQVQCDAPNTGKYSLARNCDDCKQAYKNWLCTVSIPRCEEFSNNAPWLQMRNIMAPFLNDTNKMDDNITQTYGTQKAFNSSRLARIDEDVQPGPYKEVLPCDYLCYDIVQSCASSMGFSCPLPGKLGFNTSYGVLNENNTVNNTDVTCNYPGSAHYKNTASVLVSLSWVLWVGLLGGTLSVII
ncbi:calcium influx-promoting protein ehs1 [Apiospora rasikravindrae]|uniref:Calcium influx-promoting protein ehs1 n=1 Tax=Apiospora rasikravindrae TaxID=990691 RepID=A0ABR1RSU0_9PEZI